MSETPSSPIERLSGFLSELEEKRTRPLYLLVNDAFELLDARGHAEYYGFGNLSRGEDLSERLLFLVGLETESSGVTTLPILEMTEGVYARVHAVRVRNGWGIAFSDSTEQHKLQREQQQLAHDLSLAQRELRKKHAQLEKAMQLKSQFIGRMSHEFRTPLSSILGFAALAQEDLGDHNRLQNDLQAIKRGGNYLLSLVDNLLDQAVIENDELLMRPTACSIQQLLDELEELFQPTAHQKGISLAWWIESELPQAVWLDEIRLRQVLVNLIGNAIKYTREGGVTVSMEWAGEELKISVEDTGAGIPNADLQHLFEPFKQGSDKHNIKPGAGLGLTISRSIVQRMGGELELHSQLGKGTTATFTVAAPVRTRQADPGTRLEDRHIILLEEDPDTRELISIFLQGAGVQLSVARDEDECVALIARHPDLVLVNLLQEPHHRLLLRRLQQEGFQGPVVATGAQDQQALHQEVLQAGYADLLTKPIRRAELIGSLADALTRKD